MLRDKVTVGDHAHVASIGGKGGGVSAGSFVVREILKDENAKDVKCRRSKNAENAALARASSVGLGNFGGRTPIGRITPSRRAKPWP